MQKQKNHQSGVSLLFPADHAERAGFQHWGKNAPGDLGLERLAKALSYGQKYEKAVKNQLLQLCPDPTVISYRQEVLQDFLDQPGLVQHLADCLPLLAKLRDYAESRPLNGTEDTLHQTLGRLTELNTYLNLVGQLRQALQANQAQIRSNALRELAALLDQITAETAFQSLSKSLPELVARLNGIPSITIGVNLNAELLPVEAVLLSINEKPFKGKGSSLLDKLMGGVETQGIGPLHEVNHEYVEAFDRIVKLPTRSDPLMVPLFRDLYELLKPTIAAMARSLRQYAQVQAGRLLPLEDEIAFYLGAVAFIRRLQAAGLPICRPEIAPVAERSAKLEGMFNLLLASHRLEAGQPTDVLVLNDASFGPEGRIFILTGPNQGGKTVYTQAVGMAQLLFQAGLWVPAQKAALSPVDGIYTHFATEEEFNSRQGRLSEEAQHLGEIFKTLTRHSLVLLNESLSSTSPRESFTLSLDIVRALRLYEARAIFATHLHELADDLDKLNSEGQGDSRVVSLVAGIEAEDASQAEDVTRTFQIKPSPPRGISYARGIAQRFGISYEQLAEQKKTASQR